MRNENYLFVQGGSSNMKKIFTFISEENIEEGIKEGEVDLQHPNQLGNAYIAMVILKEVFGIKFDPEKYWKNNQKVVKFPEEAESPFE